MTLDSTTHKVIESPRSTHGSGAQHPEPQFLNLSLPLLPPEEICSPINLAAVSFSKIRPVILDRGDKGEITEPDNKRPTLWNYSAHDNQAQASPEKSHVRGFLRRMGAHLLDNFLHRLDSLVNSLHSSRWIESAKGYAGGTWEKFTSYFNKSTPTPAPFVSVPVILVFSNAERASRSEASEKVALKLSPLSVKGGDSSSKSRSRKKTQNGPRFCMPGDDLESDLFNAEVAHEEERKAGRHEQQEDKERAELKEARDTLLELAERFDATRNDPRVYDIIEALGTPYDVLERSEERLRDIQKEVADKPRM